MQEVVSVNYLTLKTNIVSMTLYPLECKTTRNNLTLVNERKK
jgi:hypothetical protein